MTGATLEEGVVVERVNSTTQSAAELQVRKYIKLHFIEKPVLGVNQNILAEESNYGRQAEAGKVLTVGVCRN